MTTPTVTIEDFCIALYCAYTTPEALRPDGDTIAFTAESMPDKNLEYVRAEFHGVREYSSRAESGRELGPGDRVELSVVELEGEPGSWRVWFNPWYSHDIEFRCARILINGAEVIGQGRHLQDDLPLKIPVVPRHPAGAA